MPARETITGRTVRVHHPRGAFGIVIEDVPDRRAVKGQTDRTGKTYRAGQRMKPLIVELESGYRGHYAYEQVEVIEESIAADPEALEDERFLAFGEGPGS